MNAFLKLQQIRDILYGRERFRLKTSGQITSVFHVIFFRMYERDTATEKRCDIVLQTALGHFLTQRFKESTKWTAKVTKISKYVQMVQKLGNSS